MRQVHYPGPETMLQMPWDDQLQELIETTRAALSFHSRADVVRLALHMIPDIIFNSIDADFVEPGMQQLLQQSDGTAQNSTNDEPIESGESNTITLLDSYKSVGDTALAVVRANKQDVEKSRLAAQLCALEVGEFAYRATTFLALMEAQAPGYRAQISSSHAQEDLAARKVLGSTDIQPWGEEDYRDYGLPEED